jgi:hypothetical protein
MLTANQEVQLVAVKSVPRGEGHEQREGDGRDGEDATVHRGERAVLVFAHVG